MAEDSYKEGETLISRHGDGDSDDGGGDFDQLELNDPRDQQSNALPPSSDSSAQTKPSKWRSNCYVVTASIMASLGGVLFGYDIGIISGAILQLRDVFCLSCLDQELVISAMLIGAIVGSLVGGFLIDHFGRRLTIVANAAVFLVGALILGFSPNFAVLVVGRVILGFAVSVSATGECIYISEIAPANRRGFLVSLNELGITLGLLLAYLCNFLFISQYNGWRWMFALSAIPAVIQGVGMFLLPPSPRYLMLKKKELAAEGVLQKLRGTTRVDKELSGIRMSIASEKNRGCLDLCRSEDGMRGRMMVGVGLVFFQQFTGQPNVLYYAPTIFEDIGFQSDSAATLATVGLGLVKVIMTVIALMCVDKFGRRKLLITGSIMMGVSIFTLGVVCHFEQAGVASKSCLDHSKCSHSIVPHNHSFLQTSSLPPENIAPTSGYTFTGLQNSSNANAWQKKSDTSTKNYTAKSLYSNPVGASHKNPTSMKHEENPDVIDKGVNSTSNTEKGNNSDSGSMVQRVVGFIALMGYVAAYGFSFGPVTWLVLSEIFPAAVKGRAIAMATVFNWGTNLIITFTFLDIMNGLGVTWTFTLFAIVCAFSVMFIFSFVPETKNRTLEQVSQDMKTRPPLTRLRQNWSGFMCCISPRTSHHTGSNYSRVQSETVT